jgi:hypothetical protein
MEREMNEEEGKFKQQWRLSRVTSMMMSSVTNQSAAQF